MAVMAVDSPVGIALAEAELKALNGIPYDAALTCPKPTWRQSHGAFFSGFRARKPNEKKANLAGQWVIISGGNSGIGREAALRFSSWGANIILACRQPPPHEPHPDTVKDECRKRATDAGFSDATIEWWELDCAKLASVETFCQRWLDSGRVLDILCNNAGIGGVPAGKELTEDGYHIVMQVNFLSMVLITLRLLPSLKQSKAPRIVNTTSAAHLTGEYSLDNWKPGLWTQSHHNPAIYGSSKLYNQCWLTELQSRLIQNKEYKKITIQGVHPGFVNTAILGKTQEGGILLKVALALVTRFTIDPEQGSNCITHAATAPEAGPDPALQGIGASEGRGGGRYWDQTYEVEPHPYVRDRDARGRVWRKAAEELKLAEKGLLEGLGGA